MIDNDLKPLFEMIKPQLKQILKDLLDCRKTHRGLPNDEKRRIKAIIKKKNEERLGRKSPGRPRKQKDTL